MRKDVVTTGDSSRDGLPHAEDATPNISLVICTFNRADMLRETLESYAGMAATCATPVELLVVDNNSSDGTGALARQFASIRDDTRYLFESAPGLSNARNAGIREARGRIIAFADDDVYFDAGWLDALNEGFARSPDAACIGGRTVQQFEAGPPTWLHETLRYIYGTSQSEHPDGWFEFPRHPFGVNMAFRKEVFDRIGLFDARLGRIGESLLSGEESDIFRRMELAGLRARYVPEAVVHHRIPKSRTEPEWVLSRSYWQGVSEVVFGQLHEPLSRLALARLIVRDAWWVVRLHTGGRWSPRAAYWYHKGLPLHARAWSELRRGRIHQAMKELSGNGTHPLQTQGS